MPKDKQKKGGGKRKAGKKSAQLAIRIEKAERDAFVSLCEAQDTSAAREIRRFMREFVAAHSAPPASEPAAPRPRKARAGTTAPAAAEDKTSVAPKRRTPRSKPTPAA